MDISAEIHFIHTEIFVSTLFYLARNVFLELYYASGKSGSLPLALNKHNIKCDTAFLFLFKLFSSKQLFIFGNILVCFFSSAARENR